MKTAELTGAQLDYWVAKAEDEFAAFINDGACHCAVQWRLPS
jgi:hypothetical protein